MRTDLPTTPLEHFFIANELTRLGVRFTSLAPCFTGRFEKGVDYIGRSRGSGRRNGQACCYNCPLWYL